ncbi:hypothetical protein UC8_01460 [Roseimaritima ulvae]|uniref:DUF218 domain-containing protein n=1 Tax=Roseimaritima ulvae TaxID=980254 RepID=A0A5B9QW68_9BACT|nr:hypothetical protein UC8_01460 [Roseimaritima ulvae]
MALVSSAWHMYRVLMISEHVFPRSTTFCCQPTIDGCNIDNWPENAAFRNLVANELRYIAKLIEGKVQLPRRFRSESPEA